MSRQSFKQSLIFERVRIVVPTAILTMQKSCSEFRASGHAQFPLRRVMRPRSSATTFNLFHQKW